jgi:hypothetical protein
VSNQFLSAQWAPFADLTQHQVSPSGQTLLHQAAQNEQHALEVQHGVAVEFVPFKLFKQWLT